MHRKASFKIFVTRREMLYVGDMPDHCLMLTEMEGEAHRLHPRGGRRIRLPAQRGLPRPHQRRRPHAGLCRDHL